MINQFVINGTFYNTDIQISCKLNESRTGTKEIIKDHKLGRGGGLKHNVDTKHDLTDHFYGNANIPTIFILNIITLERRERGTKIKSMEPFTN